MEPASTLVSATFITQDYELIHLFGICWSVASPLLLLVNTKTNKGAIDGGTNHPNVQENSRARLNNGLASVNVPARADLFTELLESPSRSLREKGTLAHLLILSIDSSAKRKARRTKAPGI